jgi:hypothetical protein
LPEGWAAGGGCAMSVNPNAARRQLRAGTDAGNLSVSDEGQGHKYFTQTCNLIDDIDLTLYERALYKCFKRICGESPGGYCSVSTDHLAARTGMSAGAVSKAKKGLLSKDRPELRGKALIDLEEVPGRSGRGGQSGRPQHRITIVDIWPENMAYYEERRKADYERRRSGAVEPPRLHGGECQPSLFVPPECASQVPPEETETPLPSSPGELGHSQPSSRPSSPGELGHSQPSSPGEPKNNKSLKKILKEQQQSQGGETGTGAATRSATVAAFDFVSGILEDLSSLGVKTDRGTIERLVKRYGQEAVHDQVMWLPQRVAQNIRLLTAALKGSYEEPGVEPRTSPGVRRVVAPTSKPQGGPRTKGGVWQDIQARGRPTVLRELIELHEESRRGGTSDEDLSLQARLIELLKSGTDEEVKAYLTDADVKSRSAHPRPPSRRPVSAATRSGSQTIHA